MLTSARGAGADRRAQHVSGSRRCGLGPGPPKERAPRVSGQKEHGGEVVPAMKWENGAGPRCGKARRSRWCKRRGAGTSTVAAAAGWRVAGDRRRLGSRGESGRERGECGKVGEKGEDGRGSDFIGSGGSGSGRDGRQPASKWEATWSSWGGQTGAVFLGESGGDGGGRRGDRAHVVGCEPGCGRAPYFAATWTAMAVGVGRREVGGGADGWDRRSHLSAKGEKEGCKTDFCERAKERRRGIGPGGLKNKEEEILLLFFLF